MTESIENPEAVLAELRRAQEDLKNLRAELQTLGTAKEELQAQLDADQWKPKALDAQVRLALHNQGIKDADRLMPYIGTEGIEFGEDGKLTGLDERMSALKKDLPEVFDPKVRAGGKADLFAKDPVEQKVDPIRQAVRQAQGHSA